MDGLHIVPKRERGVLEETGEPKLGEAFRREPGLGEEVTEVPIIPARFTDQIFSCQLLT